MTPPTDRILEEIFQTTHDRLLHRAASILDDPGAADDLVQELYLRLPTLLPRANHQWVDSCEPEISEILGFLDGCLRRLAANQRARNFRRKKLIEQYFSDLNSPNTHQTDETSEQCKAVLKRLPTSSAEVLRLRYLEGLSGREIGQSLGISEGSARDRVYRALKLARDSGRACE